MFSEYENFIYDSRLEVKKHDYMNVGIISKTTFIFMLCAQIFLDVKTKTKNQLMYTTFSELVVLMYWTGKPMSNLLSYCGLVDARIRVSIKDLPANLWINLNIFYWI